MKLSPYVLCGILLGTSLVATDLREEFVSPPSESAPMVWWDWLNGNISKPGIKADLESMQSVGIGGFHIREINPKFPAGSVRYGTDEWYEHVRYTLQLCKELGLEAGLTNSPGWSGHGGPWVTLEDSIKKFTWSETTVEGGQSVELDLPIPDINFDYYEDVCVLAVPADAAWAGGVPQLTASVEGINTDLLIDGSTDEENSSVTITGLTELTLTYQYASPVTVRMASITLPYQRGKSVTLKGTIEVSQDGTIFTKLRDYVVSGSLYAHEGYIGYDIILNFPFAPTNAQYFRIKIGNIGALEKMSEANFSNNYRVENYRSKSLSSPIGPLLPDQAAMNPMSTDADAIPASLVLDISDKMDADGKLVWDAPAGRWTILRFGYTTTGLPNHPAPDEGKGLEIDKMNKAALRRGVENSLGRIFRENADLKGTTLKTILTDSWESAQQSWTAGYEGEFERIRGYSMKTFIPVLTGRVVESLPASELFLLDYRRTASDLIAENYFGEWKKIAAEHGMQHYAEAYGGRAFNEAQNVAASDVKMAEFWYKQDRDSISTAAVLRSAYAAHQAGEKIVAAESFTATAQDANYIATPRTIKPVGDQAFANGLTKIYMHSYAHQPLSDDLVPGLTTGSTGTNFSRHVTWWPKAKDWMSYMARCQHMLRQGAFVADFLQVKNAEVGSFHSDKYRAFPTGYVLDQIDMNALGNIRATNGVMTSPGGMEYRILLFPTTWWGDLDVLRHIKRIADAGVLVVAVKPYGMSSLNDIRNQSEWEAMVAQLWDQGHSNIQDMPLYNAVKVPGLTADCLFTPANTKHYRFIHRRDGERDIYFICNTSEESAQVEVSFRVSGKLPELWNPVTGEITPAPMYRVEGGLTYLPMNLDDGASMFVVFEKSLPERWVQSAELDGRPLHIGKDVVPSANGAMFLANTGILKLTMNDQSSKEVELANMTVMQLPGPWRASFSSPVGIHAEYVLENPGSWTEIDNGALRYLSGTGVYKTTFTAPRNHDGSCVMLDLGDIRDVARVWVNGRFAGTLWTLPYRIDVTKFVKEGENQLEVEVTNRWVNQLIKDGSLPQDIVFQSKYNSGQTYGIIEEIPEWVNDSEYKAQRAIRTFISYRTNFSKVTPPESGLLGPVTLSWLKRVGDVPPLDLSSLTHDEMLAYAFTSDATLEPGHLLAYLPTTSMTTEGKLMLTFTPLRNDLVYEVQESTDLQTWQTIYTIEGDESTHAIPVESRQSSVSSPSLFLRVKVAPKAQTEQVPEFPKNLTLSPIQHSKGS